MLAELELPVRETKPLFRESAYPTLDISPFIATDDDFYAFCLRNSEYKFERNADKTIIIMSLTGGKTGKRNSELNAEIVFWKRKNGGNAFDSSTGFRLPNGAVRSPDLAWVSDVAWNALSEAQQEKFPQIAPEFVVEIKSFTDNTDELKYKMKEYIENGVLLGWLIDPYEKIVSIYRADGSIEKVKDFTKKLSGEDVLNGFEFDLKLLDL